MAVSAFATQPRPDEISPSTFPVVRVLPFLVPTPHVYRASSIEGARPLARPKQILLGTVTDPGFRLLKPIPVGLEYQDGTVVASWQEIEEFGTGTSTTAACEDLGHTISELYRSLEADQERLGPDLHRVWGVLQNHLSRRR